MGSQARAAALLVLNVTSLRLLCALIATTSWPQCRTTQPAAPSPLANGVSATAVHPSPRAARPATAVAQLGRCGVPQSAPPVPAGTLATRAYARRRRQRHG